MRRLIMLSIATACLAACDTAPTSEARAKQAVRERLFDPESAQFSELFKSPSDNGAICGLVNAKNRMGGYAGRAPFYYSTLTDYAAIVGEPLDDGDFIAYYYAMGGASEGERRREMAARCTDVRDWELACGRRLDRTPHHLCAKMLAESPSLFYLTLRKLAKGE
jgi:hypothetical protein